MGAVLDDYGAFSTLGGHFRIVQLAQRYQEPDDSHGDRSCRALGFLRRACWLLLALAGIPPLSHGRESGSNPFTVQSHSSAAIFHFIIPRITTKRWGRAF